VIGEMKHWSVLLLRSSVGRDEIDAMKVSRLQAMRQLLIVIQEMGVTVKVNNIVLTFLFTCFHCIFDL